MDQPSFDRVKDEIKNRGQGYQNTGKQPFFSAPVEYKPLQIGPRELQFLQGLGITRDEIGGIFGVPKSMLTSDDVNRANADSGRRQFSEDTIEPKLRLLEQKINEYLVPLFDPRLFGAFDSTVPADRQFRLNEIQSHLSTGYATINEERAVDGLEPVEWGEVPIMGMGMGPIGSVDETPQDNLPVDETPQEDQNQTDEGTDEETGKDQGKGFKSFTVEKRAEVWKKFDWRVRPHEDAVKAAARKLFREQELDVLRNLKKSFKIKGPQEALTDFIFNIEKYAAKWREEIGGLDKGIYQDAGKTALEDLNSPISFDIENPRALRFMRNRERKIDDITDTTYKELKRTLDDGMEAGESITSLRGRVKEYFDVCENYRAERIARTETIGSYNAGTNEGYKQSDVVAGKEWSSTLDDRTRDTHAEMDGQRVGLDEDFESPSGAHAQCPGSFGVAEEDINCRCATLPVLKEEWE
jgi:SPP1 gp7 family putative phage head morphogenesis protein